MGLRNWIILAAVVLAVASASATTPAPRQAAPRRTAPPKQRAAAAGLPAAKQAAPARHTRSQSVAAAPRGARLREPLPAAGQAVPPKPSPARTKAPAPKPASAPRPAPAKSIVVDWEAGLVYPLEDGEPARAPIVTNNRKFFVPRDLGTFRISEKVEDKRSNLYNSDGEPLEPGDEPARMRYWMRLGWTAQGFHQSGLFTAEGPRHRSNGCYRLSPKSARWLYRWAEPGTPVHIVMRLRGSRFAWLLEKKGSEEDPPGRPRPASGATRVAAERARTPAAVR